MGGFLHRGCPTLFFYVHYQTWRRLDQRKYLLGPDEHVMVPAAAIDKAVHLAQDDQFGARFKALGHSDQGSLIPSSA
jgi:hypothetical protein